ncbi:MAG: hypothetical protein HC836_34875 [Richelia sp. RM2_1_2]|nr:hypothetical protein [Richelia sp. SM2_1_7]NJM21735.1 hypothetical protein [Richelia sp. SM1_7_0]NJN12199.1 hypothetical protein [Richelia sp. RM1_1_1]NJO30703.1 hypothetical protein [Richelia sp. SL_2_1]NJO63221.1 hypothetical protein [Richelia sp. RM2_1_2]
MNKILILNDFNYLPAYILLKWGISMPYYDLIEILKTIDTWIITNKQQLLNDLLILIDT